MGEGRKPTATKIINGVSRGWHAVFFGVSGGWGAGFPWVGQSGPQAKWLGQYRGVLVEGGRR